MPVIVFTMIIGWLAALLPFNHPFGTDRTGNDVLIRALKSILPPSDRPLGNNCDTALAIVRGILAATSRAGATAPNYSTRVSSLRRSCSSRRSCADQCVIDHNAIMFETVSSASDFRLFLLCPYLG